MKKMFSRLAEGTAHLAGHPVTCAGAFGLVAVWAASGPVFDYSEQWQLVINTGTTVITFLMVFLIQSTTNRDMAAMQAKLDEIIRASAARNEFRGIDRKSEDEIRELRNDRPEREGAGSAGAVAQATNEIEIAKQEGSI